MLRQLIIDWLDDNYHFGEAATKIRDDEMSFLQNGSLRALAVGSDEPITDPLMVETEKIPVRESRIQVPPPGRT